MTESRSRLLLASFVAPFIGAFVGVCFNVIWWEFARGDATFSAQSSALSLLIIPIWVLYVGSLIGLPAMLMLGLPAHVLLYRIGWRNLVAYIASGALTGALALSAILGSLYLISRAPIHGTNDVLPLALAIGVATSTAFWLIRRPDRDGPNPHTPAP